MGERIVEVEEQFKVLESLKPKLGRFIKEKLYSWGLSEQDILLVDEAGFGYTGIPIYGPELRAAVEGVVGLTLILLFGKKNILDRELKYLIQLNLTFLVC